MSVLLDTISLTETAHNAPTMKSIMLSIKLAVLSSLLSADSTNIGLDAAVFVREVLSKLMESATLALNIHPMTPPLTAASAIKDITS